MFLNKAKNYIQLHLNILLFSLTSVFSKAASVQLNRGGIKNPLLYVFLFLMVANCGIYAIAWQKVIEKILFVNRICKPQRLSDLVPDLGRAHFS